MPNNLRISQWQWEERNEALATEVKKMKSANDELKNQAL